MSDGVDHHLSELSTSSHRIPSSDDFHFYYKFGEFKLPVEEIARRTQSMLSRIGSAEHIWGRGSAFPGDIDDAYEWVVNANDDVLELVEEILDEFRRIKKEEAEEEIWGDGAVKKKNRVASYLGLETEELAGIDPESGTGSDKKSKVSFHEPTISKPQYKYNIVVDNTNKPFQHVLLQRSDDGQRFIHPLEKQSVLDFVDKDNFENLVPEKPPSLDCTPFKLVEDVKGLKELATKLYSVDEFAVDLEHNQYRSFQGLTCLMQISTRTEDFIIDTLKLHNHVGPYLREVFKDPSKKKVLHGANRDIVWLQRDFGIYVCNMFDTGQASRVLKLERYSLQYLLQHFCGVTANKEYQNADWRVRPLPDVMLRYGREDTHYLLYIYDLMRIKLYALSKDSESSENPLLEVYQRSYDVCMQLYEKDLLTEDSYLRIKGLPGAGFNAQQLAIVSGLCEWRDTVGRADDESTGYILPNKIILEIAKQMPVITSNLRRLVGKSKLPYAERNLDIIVNIVRHSMENAAAFEEAAIHLKEVHAANVAKAAAAAAEAAAAALKDGTEAPGSHMPNMKVECAENGSSGNENAISVDISEKSLISSDLEEYFQDEEDIQGQEIIKSDCLTSELRCGSLTILEKNGEDANVGALSTAKVNGENGQVLQMPLGPFDATLMGNSASERKLNKKGKEIKLEQTTSSVNNLPSSSILGNSEKSTSTQYGTVMLDSDSDVEDMMLNNL